MELVPLESGSTYGARVLKRNSGLELADADKQVVGALGLKGVENFGATLEANDGSWTARGVGGSKWKGPESWSVVDPGGTEVATLTKDGSITAPGGAVTFGGSYEIPGLYVAKVGGVAKLLPGLSKTMFDCEVTPTLLARPDASLVFLLAAWCTYKQVSSKIGD